MKTNIECVSIIAVESVITVCTGYRCAALLEASAGACLPSLRSAVAASSQVMLLSTGCVDACAQAPVMALSSGLGGQGHDDVVSTSWLGPVGPEEVCMLSGWIAAGSDEPLPPPLTDVVFVVRIGP